MIDTNKMMRDIVLSEIRSALFVINASIAIVSNKEYSKRDEVIQLIGVKVDELDKIFNSLPDDYWGIQ